MNWEDHFAQRTRHFRRNTVREFLKLAGNPGIISFAGGLPDSDLLPVAKIRKATERALERFGAKALQYGPSEGIPELRKTIASRFENLGVTAENVLITNGSMQALDLLGRVLLDEGDHVVVQNPTYLAALAAWAPFNVHFQSFDTWQAGGERKPKLAYSIPNFCNPTGETLTESQRRLLVQRCSSEQIPLVEDDAYGELRFENESLPSLLEICATSEGCVIHVGTFSKILAPGLRLGWIIAAKPLIAKLVQLKQVADLHTSTFCQYIALQFIEDNCLAELLPQLRTVYRQKRDWMLQSLANEMPPTVSWSHPDGGLFIMLHLPSGVDGRSITEKALRNGVLVVPGEEFHIHSGHQTVRLNFSHSTKDQICEGISRLATVLKSELGRYAFQLAS